MLSTGPGGVRSDRTVQDSSQRKRHAPGYTHQHEHEDVDEEQTPKRTRLYSSTHGRVVDFQPLACPMYKFDPGTYHQCERYVAGGVSTLHRIK